MAAQEHTRLQSVANGVLDVWVVTDFDGSYVTARPVHDADALPQRVAFLSGIRVGLGDEVLIGRVAGQPVIIGATRSENEGFGLIQATPILVPATQRSGNGAWTATTDLASLRTTVFDLDPGASYLVTATCGAYLTSASSGTKVGMGVRIGFASDPDSTATPEWGPGHQNTVPTWATFTMQRIVSSITSIQATGRAWASASGNHSIGDGQLDLTITPLYTAGRV